MRFVGFEFTSLLKILNSAVPQMTLLSIGPKCGMKAATHNV